MLTWWVGTPHGIENKYLYPLDIVIVSDVILNACLRFKTLLQITEVCPIEILPLRMCSTV